MSEEQKGELRPEDVAGFGEEHDIIESTMKSLDIENEPLLPDTEPDPQESTDEVPEEPSSSEEGQGEETEDTSTEEESTKPDEEVPEEPLSRGWRAIKKRDKQLLEAQTEIKRQTEDLKQQREQINSWVKEVQSDPVAGLAKVGISWDDMAARVLDGKEIAPKPAEENNEIQTLKAELGALKDQLLINNFNKEIDFTLQNPEFRLLASKRGAEDSIKELVSAYYQQYGKALKTEEAAAMLQEEWEQELQTYGSNDAVREALKLPPKNNEDPTAQSHAKPMKKKAGGKPPPTISTKGAPTTAEPEDDDDDDILKAAKAAGIDLEYKPF